MDVSESRDEASSTLCMQPGPKGPHEHENIFTHQRQYNDRQQAIQGLRIFQLTKFGH